MKLCMNKEYLKKHIIASCIGVILLVIFTAMLGIFLIFTPKYADDYEFMLGLKEWYESQGIWNTTEGGNIFKAGIPWNDVYATWSERYETDNCRLSNILAVLFELMPKWVGSGLSLLSWFCAMWGMMKLARIKMSHYAMISVLIFLCIVLAPWRDNMGIMDYQFNYVLPSGFAILVLLHLLRGGRGVLFHAVTIVTAILLGAWTEAFSVPIIIGLGFIAIVDRKSRCIAIWETIGGLFIGILWLLSSPHFGVRVEEQVFTHVSNLKFIFKLMVTEIPGFSLLILMTLIYIRIKGWQEVIADRRLMFALVSGIVSFGLCSMTTGSMRAGWWAGLAAIFGISYMLNRLLGQYFRKRLYRSVTLTLFMTGLVWSALIPVDMYLIKTSREYPRALRAFLDNQEEEIFVYARPDTSFPLLSQLFHAQYLYWEVTFFQNRYYFGGDGHSVNKWKIIPDDLKYFKAEEAERIPGDMGVIRKGSYLIVPYSEDDSTDGYADIKFGPIQKEEVPVRITPFRSAGDGKKYGFVILGDRMVEYCLLGISSMSGFESKVQSQKNKTG